MDEKIRYEGSFVIIDGAKYPIVDNWYDKYGIHYQLVEQRVVDDMVNYLVIINGEYKDKYYACRCLPERSRVERDYVSGVETEAILSDKGVDFSVMTPERRADLQNRKEYVERELENLIKEKIVLIDLLHTGRRLSISDIKEITVIDRSLDGTYDIQLRIEDGTKRYGEIYDYIAYNPETRFIDEDISLETRLGDEGVEQLKSKLDELIRKGA